MKTPTKLLSLALIAAGGVALAKEGVQNPVVKERMEVMKIIGANTKVLGGMAGGKMEFDAAKAAAAADEIEAAAARVAAVFEAQETDPVSEAKPGIWTNWDDFITKADALTQAAAAMDTSSLEGVQAGMGAIGGSCKSCHSDYRL